MPNWCSTRIVIKSENKEELNNLYEKLNEWTSKEIRKSDFGPMWLGNIVLASGVGTVDKNKKTDLRCRGYVDNIDLNDNELVIQTENAWSPMLEMWKLIVDKFIPDADLYYDAEECGCGIFQSNRPELTGTYMLDPYDIEDEETDYEATEDQVVKFLQRILKTEESDLQKLLELLEDSEFIDCVSIQKREIVEI